MKKNWLVFSVLTQFIFVGCATPAWNKYPIQVPPDYSCFYGGAEGGVSYYIWKCIDSKRVVIKQSGYGFWTASADKYESSCQSVTEIESEQSLEPGQEQCKRKGHWETNPQIKK